MEEGCADYGGVSTLSILEREGSCDNVGALLFLALPLDFAFLILLIVPRLARSCALDRGAGGAVYDSRRAIEGLRSRPLVLCDIATVRTTDSDLYRHFHHEFLYKRRLSE